MSYGPAPVPVALSPHLLPASTVIHLPDGMVRQVTGEGVPHAMYGAQCQSCDASSGIEDNDPMPTWAWMVQHTRTMPTHQRFLASVQSHWQVDLPVDPPSVQQPQSLPATLAAVPVLPDQATEPPPVPNRFEICRRCKQDTNEPVFLGAYEVGSGPGVMLYGCPECVRWMLRDHLKACRICRSMTDPDRWCKRAWAYLDGLREVITAGVST